MKIDLCKLFGVEEGEEFKFNIGKAYYKYIINCNELVYYDENKKEWVKSSKNIIINDLPNLKIVKLPKKKEFKNDELAIMRSLPKKYRWVARDEIGNALYIYSEKPIKRGSQWQCDVDTYNINIYTHLFNSIQWEDEEPVFIDDYVERGVE